MARDGALAAKPMTCGTAAIRMWTASLRLRLRRAITSTGARAGAIIIRIVIMTAGGSAGTTVTETMTATGIAIETGIATGTEAEIVTAVGNRLSEMVAGVHAAGKSLSASLLLNS